MRHRILTAGLTVLLVVVLLGCGGAGSRVPGPASSAAPAPGSPGTPKAGAFDAADSSKSLLWLENAFQKINNQ
jgi:hypothetical protein